MDKKLVTASAISGLAGVVLGLLSARAIPQKVELVEPGIIAPMVPSLAEYSSVSKIVHFADNLAPGMRAFAQYEGKRIEL